MTLPYVIRNYVDRGLYGMMWSMTYEEFQRHLGKAGLTLRQFADLLKMNRISLSNYGKKGEVPSHLALIVALMGEMAEHRVDFRSVLTKIDIEPKKPRGGATKGKFGGGRQMAMQFTSGVTNSLSVKDRTL